MGSSEPSLQPVGHEPVGDVICSAAEFNQIMFNKIFKAVSCAGWVGEAVSCYDVSGITDNSH